MIIEEMDQETASYLAFDTANFSLCTFDSKLVLVSNTTITNVSVVYMTTFHKEKVLCRLYLIY